MTRGWAIGRILVNAIPSCHRFRLHGYCCAAESRSVWSLLREGRQKLTRFGTIFVVLWSVLSLASGCAWAEEAEEVDDLFRDVLENTPVSPIPPRLQASVEAIETGAVAIAAAELNEIVSQGSTDLPALRLLASAYGRLGAYLQAIEICQRVALLDSLDAGVSVALGYFHQKQGDLDVAERYYSLALRQDPGVIQAYQGLGWIYLRRRMFEEALSMTSKTTERAPEYAPNYVLMGRVLTAQGFYDAAAVTYRRAFALQPSLRERFGVLLQEVVRRHRLER
jgi:tetratricopeptide (TPR) repeat protein